jgi:hypothetical protein
MSVRKWLVPLALVGLATASAALAAPELERPAATDAPAVDKLSPQEQAAVEELRGLWQQAHIANLELRLAEAKGAPERDIAAKQKAVEEARERMRQWRADHPGLGRQLRLGRHGGRGMGMRGGRGLRHHGGGMGMRGGRGTSPGGGMGMRGGRGMGPDGGMGMRGGRGMGPDGGIGMRGGRGMGPGGGMGMRGGRGMRGMMGEERGRGMRLRQRDPSQCPYLQTAPSAPAEEPKPETQPE